MTYIDETREEQISVRSDKVESEQLDRERGVVLALVGMVLEIGELGSDELPAVDSRYTQWLVTTKEYEGFSKLTIQ